jgi:hypothetical protein
MIAASADLVWATIRDFNALPKWHPDIAESEVEDGRSADSVGCVRNFVLRDGRRIREKLLALSDKDRSYTYDFQTWPFPVTNYEATIRVTPVDNPGGAFVEWWATFDSDLDVQQQLIGGFRDGVFTKGLAALKAALERG